MATNAFRHVVRGHGAAFDVVARYRGAVCVGAHLVLDVHHVVGFVLAAEQGHGAAFDVVARYRGAVCVGAHLAPDVHHVVGFLLAAEQACSARFQPALVGSYPFKIF